MRIYSWNSGKYDLSHLTLWYGVNMDLQLNTMCIAFLIELLTSFD